MRTFARIQDSVVVEMLPPPDLPKKLIPEDGDIRLLYHPDLALIEVTDIEPMPGLGWLIDGEGFSAPIPYQRSTEEIRAENKSTFDALAASASVAMTPLLMSLQLGNASDEEKVKATLWQDYSRRLNEVNLGSEKPVWPITPE